MKTSFTDGIINQGAGSEIMLMAVYHRCHAAQEMNMPVAYPDHTAGPYIGLVEMILVKVSAELYFMVVIVIAAGYCLT